MWTLCVTTTPAVKSFTSASGEADASQTTSPATGERWMRTFMEPQVSAQNTFRCRSGTCVRFSAELPLFRPLLIQGYGSEFAVKTLKREISQRKTRLLSTLSCRSTKQLPKRNHLLLCKLLKVLLNLCIFIISNSNKKKKRHRSVWIADLNNRS
jgi:hypothetical protein